MKNTNYDFKSVIQRRGTNSVKWDMFGDDLPMWVADMDFKVAPAIQKAIQKRADHPVYGYSIVPDELFESYIGRRYDFKMSHEDMLYSIGVMPSISSMIRCLTDVGDNILIQSPVYHVFFYVIEDNNRTVVENELIYDDGSYSIDFDDLDEKLKECKMMILCNPHNPIGKIWSKSDLAKIGELCRKHNVVLISDEIHCDLTDPGVKYNPFETSSDYEKTITCLSPSKSFNIAGFQSSVVHTKNQELLEKIKTQMHIDNSDACNVFAVSAVTAAYDCSQEWLEELKEVLYENKRIVRDYLANELPVIKLVECDATYLLWLDCSSLNVSSKVLSEFLRQNQGLFLSAGCDFGQCGDSFLRMNIACPQKLLKDGLDRLKRGVIALNNIKRF